jgi:hypothetical protein
MKFLFALLLALVPAFGSIITSGTVEYKFVDPFTGSSDSFSLHFSDGFDFSGYGFYDGLNPHAPTCLAAGPDACRMVPTAGANFNGPFGSFQPVPYGSIAFTFLSMAPPAKGVDDQVFTIPFTAAGSISGPYNSGGPVDPCPLPGNLDRYSCFEGLTGSGTVEFTVGFIANFANNTGAYFVKDAVYTFTAAPEPSTVAFCAIAGIVAVCRRRKRT